MSSLARVFATAALLALAACSDDSPAIGPEHVAHCRTFARDTVRWLIAADSSGATTSSKDGKESRNRPKLPVSNMPLPAQVPEAPAEEQRMPLEYRDLIR